MKEKCMFLKNRKKEKRSGGNVNESIKTRDEHEESVTIGELTVLRHQASKVKEGDVDSRLGALVLGLGGQ